MSSPACPDRRSRSSALDVVRWLSAEPFRLFFVSGALWSIAGVSLWPLYFAGKLAYYPNFAHARLMIETFGGAFVIGFLGTAGPRMVSAPRLTVAELAALFTLHSANGSCHVMALPRAGDCFFLGLLGLLVASLGGRVARARDERPPPQMLLALTGLLCGIAGVTLWLSGAALTDPRLLRLSGLLLYQGLLLPPALGIGSFFFQRILGGEFGEPSTAVEGSRRLRRAVLAAVLLVASFPLEAAGWVIPGHGLRAGTAALYLLIEVRWRRAPGDPPRGSLAGGLVWALALGFAGLAFAGFFWPRHVPVEHLLYVGGFGLLMLIVSSRVLFGHAGDAAGSTRRSWFVRGLIFLAVLAATTRATADFFPRSMISHYQYAAWTWSLLAALWLAWHARRFATRDPD